MTDPQARSDKEAAPPPPPPGPRVIDAQQLLGRDREIWIDHGGVRYRLRLTRRNRLVLQK